MLTYYLLEVESPDEQDTTPIDIPLLLEAEFARIEARALEHYDIEIHLRLGDEVERAVEEQ